MTALRQKMIAAMRQRGFAQRTHNTYLMVITDLARYFHRPPDTLSTDDLQHFFNHLVQERGLSAASCRVYTAYGFCTCTCCSGRRLMCRSPSPKNRSGFQSC